MLTDKLIIMLTVAQTGIIGSNMSDIKRINESDKTQEEKNEKIDNINKSIRFFNNVFEEIKALEDYIQSDSKSIMTDMHHKLDEVLMGPYYQAGQELMENSKNDFEKRV